MDRQSCTGAGMRQSTIPAKEGVVGREQKETGGRGGKTPGGMMGREGLD